MRRSGFVLVVLLLLLAPGSLLAQGVPTGTLSGRVSDPDGLSLPGVTVTARSPALQGPRSATTSPNGDYLIPFLPAGDYTVTFEIAGFQPLKRKSACRSRSRSRSTRA
jgi:hypothetical protein